MTTVIYEFLTWTWKAKNWKTQAAEMVYTTTQRFKILKGSAGTQTDKKAAK